MIKLLPINKVKELCFEAFNLRQGYEVDNLRFNEWWQTQVMPQLMANNQVNEAADKLWNLYPTDFETIAGKRYPVKLMDYEEFCDIYGRVIIDNQELHLEIIADLLYGKQEGLITYGIEKFIKSRAWEGIHKLRLMDEDSTPQSIKNEDF